MIKKNWNFSGIPTFKDEVLSAHGQNKRSFHLLVRSFDESGIEVLFKNFRTCKHIALKVNNILATRVQVECKSKRSDNISRQTTSYIDLSIYIRDRPFRLLLSCKTECPDRLFVMASGNKGLGDLSMIANTLVVPHMEDSVKIISFHDPPCSPIYSINPSPQPSQTRSCNRKFNQTVPLSWIEKLKPWVKYLASHLPGSNKRGVVIKEWRCDRFDSMMIHFTINRAYASHCYSIGRSHCANDIRISIDLRKGYAYQSCWDNECMHQTLLSRSPFHGSMPTHAEVQRVNC